MGHALTGMLGAGARIANVGIVEHSGLDLPHLLKKR
jgi:hypothetical protein